MLARFATAYRPRWRPAFDHVTSCDFDVLFALLRDNPADT
jgi:hypothetical protein